MIPRWQNISKARPAGDTGGTHYTATPYPRHDTSIYNTENPGAGCNTLPAGSCGNWLVGGDLNGLSIQEIEDTVDDIMACAGDDTTHAKNDHNCYLKNGDTVDMRATKLFGGQWILARKNWQGVFGFIDRCDPVIPSSVTMVSGTYNDGAGGFTINTTFNTNPPQVKYLTADLKATSNEQHYNTYFGGNGTIDYSLAGSASSTSSVGRTTGIVSQTWNFSYDTHDGSSSPEEANAVFTWLAGKSFADVVAYFSAWKYVDVNGGVQNPDTAYYTQSGTTFKLMSGAYVFDAVNGITVADQPLEVLVIDVAGGSFSRSVYSTLQVPPVPPGNAPAVYKLIYTESCQISNTSISYQYDDNYASLGLVQPWDSHGSGTLTLSDAYTSAECYQDFKDALAAWDMSDLNLAAMRTDEVLALAPLCIFDEVGPSVPAISCGSPSGSVFSGSGPTMDDYSATQNGDGSWPQRAWIDPDNYIWKYPNGSYGPPSGFTGGATLLSPLRTGAIIAHTQPGSDRHFWFNYTKQQRELDPTWGYYEWFADTHGAFSESPLPPVTMRWMDNEEAQYDGAAFRNGADPHPGNYPQAFWTQRGGVIRGAKFVQASERWPAVNFGRPCGADKYAVDQPSVCCITGGDATSGFTVKKTGNAIAPLASGGLVVNDYIVVEADGIYKISGITDNGDGTFAVTVGSKLDDLPTGYNFADPEQTADGVTHLGRLRFPTASGICGRAAITTAYASGTVTITPAAAQPWLRTDPTTGTILVDVYDASMTLVASALSLTRVSDTSFTIVHAALASAVWMTGHGVDWTHYDATPKKTGVHLEWSFNQRVAATGYTGTVPTWYGGITGCLACSVTQFTYSSGACPAAIGIVPFYSPPADTSGDLPDQNSQPPENAPVEQFPNQEMFDFPATVIFDDVYGAQWQAAVMLTMPDPFWQQPFKPDCGGASFAWSQDDGSGNADASDGSVRYYAHPPLVEALSTIPAGMSLPAGVSLLYDPSVNVIAPPYYPTGIPIGDNAGNYSSIEMDWGFTLRVCGNVGGRFRTEYNFVAC